MITRNPTGRFQRIALNRVPQANRLATRLRHYFDQHPQVSREDFFLDAIQKEMDSRALNIPLPLTDEDRRIHAWLNERLSLLPRQRHRWWAKVRRFLGLEHIKNIQLRRNHL